MPDFILIIFSATLGLALVGVSFYHRKTVANLKKQLEDLQNKHNLNPSYETQVMLSELLAGHSVFKIERLDQDNLFYRRR